MPGYSENILDKINLSNMSKIKIRGSSDKLEIKPKYYLSLLSNTCLSEPFTMNSVTVASVPPGPSCTTP